MAYRFPHCNQFLLGFAVILTLASCAGPARSPQPSAVASEGDPLGWLHWMTGTWRLTEGGTTVEEQWTAPRGGTLFGTSRTIEDDRVVFFEYLRIEDRGDDAVVYLASPMGRFPPTPFRLSERWPSRVIFTNPDHDFPQMIQYERIDDSLIATISGERRGEIATEQWVYTRAGE